MRIIEIIKDILRYRHNLKIIFGRLISVERGELPDKYLVMSAQKEESIKLNEIKNLSENTETSIARNLAFFPEVKIYNIPNARLIGPRATPLTEYRKIITEHTYGRKETLLGGQVTVKPFAILKKSFGKPTHKYGCFFSINSPYAFNYYHWTIDCLPCIRSYEALPDRPTLIVPSGRAAWQERYLELLGYEPGSYEEYSGNHLKVDSLYIASWHKSLDTMPPAPSTLRWLRSRILSNIGLTYNKLHKKIFISRSDSKKVRIVNEASIAKLLKGLGFETVTLGQLPLDNQIEIFNNAEIVIGVHGAGLTNLIFSKKTIVIEIFPHNQKFPHDQLLHFFYITNVIGGKHYSYLADFIDNNGISGVDLSKFKKAVEKTLLSL